jgi:hypothetical protein
MHYWEPRVLCSAQGLALNRPPAGGCGRSDPGTFKIQLYDSGAGAGFDRRTGPKPTEIAASSFYRVLLKAPPPDLKDLRKTEPQTSPRGNYRKGFAPTASLTRRFRGVSRRHLLELFRGQAQGSCDGEESFWARANRKGHVKAPIGPIDFPRVRELLRVWRSWI